jgi:hypothetical protein
MKLQPIDFAELEDETDRTTKPKQAATREPIELLNAIKEMVAGLSVVPSIPPTILFYI